MIIIMIKIYIYIVASDTHIHISTHRHTHTHTHYTRHLKMIFFFFFCSIIITCNSRNCFLSSLQINIKMEYRIKRTRTHKWLDEKLVHRNCFIFFFLSIIFTCFIFNFINPWVYYIAHTHTHTCKIQLLMMKNSDQ